MSQWDSYSHSVAGRRESNEDAVLILPLGDGGYFLAVADGMGGIRGGEIASAIVLGFAREFLTARFEKPVRPEQLKKVLRELYAGADAAVGKEQLANPRLAGMGTTLACVLVKGTQYVVGNIGDSRVYLCREGKLNQLTVDHTYVQDMLTRSGVKPDARLVEHYGHVVTRSIQGAKDKPDLFPRQEKWSTIASGDGFLLCSDGLIGDKSAVEQVALDRQFVGNDDLKKAAEAMVSSALEAGSTDNISVVLATWGEFPRSPVQPPHAEEWPTTVEMLPVQAPHPAMIFSPAVLTLVGIVLLALLTLFVLCPLGSSEAFTGKAPQGDHRSVREANSSGGTRDSSPEPRPNSRSDK